MRLIMQQSPELPPQYIDHEHAREHEEIGRILDEKPEITKLVFDDLTRGVRPDVGRAGLDADFVLRALIIKQMNGFSYEELAFHLADSSTYRAFCRLPAFGGAPAGSTLQDNIRLLQANTLEAINRELLGIAADADIEKGRKVRADCTVIDTNIHRPDDAHQLWDSVRVLTRLMKQAVEEFGDRIDVPFSDHTQRAKRRFKGILNAKKKTKRVSLYKDLLKVCRKTIGYANRVVVALLPLCAVGSPEAKSAIKFELEISDFIALAERVIDQTERRVLHGEKVPAGEKVLSIFEPHSDIIIKKDREIEYGHKICLTTGASSLILDCRILEGNPADTDLAVPMIKRQVEIYGRPPRQCVFDGGFASKANLEDIKELEVKDVAFSKKRGLEISDMAKSTWVYKRLTRFRAGVEAGISFLKRCFGLRRCPWRRWGGFGSYVWGSIVSANLLILARHRMA